MTTYVYTCPDHDGTDLEDYDGIGLWCGEGEHYIPPAAFDDADPGELQDALMDLREAQSDF